MKSIAKDTYGEFRKYDKRSAWNRHWAGKHTENCHVYSMAALGNVCKESGQLFWGETDLIRAEFIKKL